MPRWAVCSAPGCPAIIPRGDTRCPAHRRAADRARGTAAERGYDQQHRALRKQWEPRVAAGGVTCWRCGQPIAPSEPWDLGHDDQDRTKYRGPEHLTCNRATAGRR